MLRVNSFGEIFYKIQIIQVSLQWNFSNKFNLMQLIFNTKQLMALLHSASHRNHRNGS